MDPTEDDSNYETLLHYTCGLCELICSAGEVLEHPCLANFSKYFVDRNLYFYPRTDDCTILTRSLINGQEVSVAENILAERNTAETLSAESETVTFKNIDEQLIDAVRARPPLWNFRLPVAQRNKYTKDQLWQEVSDSLKGHYGVSEAKKKWKGLFDTFRKYDNQEKDVCSGSAATSTVKWQYYELMKFIRDVNLNRKRNVCNMTATQTNLDSEAESNDVDDLESGKSKTPRRSRAIDKLVDALSAPLPAIVLPPPPSLPLAPAPPDRVDAFLMMIGYDLRALDELTQNEAIFKIHQFIHNLKQNLA